MAALLRVVVVVVVLALLVRAARMAWRNRRLALRVWSGIRPRHVLGSLGLLVVVLATAGALLLLAPVTGFGLGSLVGLYGNAIFAPVEEVALRAGGAGGAPGPPPAWVAGLVLAFFGSLLLLFPWLAYVEERVFREGLEDAPPSRELWTALKFGLVHLVMLIPLAAALAISVAGFVYGRIYRRAYRRAAQRTVVVEGPLGVPVVARPPVARLRAEAVLETTVWHATFNSTVVAVLIVGVLATWYLPVVP